MLWILFPSTDWDCHDGTSWLGRVPLPLSFFSSIFKRHLGEDSDFEHIHHGHRRRRRYLEGA